MKVIAAIDSFKGSMTSMEAGNAVKKGILAAKPDAEVVVNPLADGGEGTVDALIEGLGAKKIPVTVTGPLGEKVSCYYGFLEETKSAVMEMASAAGITLVTKKDPLRASTYGVGEMIADALKRGCKNFMIGIGGSATNDGGIGMLKALGFEFFDEDGNEIEAEKVEVTVKVTSAGTEDTVYKKKVGKDTENINLTVQGVGTITVKVYVSGILERQTQMNLNDSNAVWTAE